MRSQTIDTQQQTSTLIPYRYRILLYLNIFLIIVDVTINTASEFIAPVRFGQLIIFIVQDVCILLSVTLLVVMILTTYVAQAGLVCLVLRMFRFPIIMATIYLVFCAIIHGLLLGDRFSRRTFVVSAFVKNEVVAFYVIQRLLSVLYYYGIKRAAYRLSDPHFYQSSKWLQNIWETRRLGVANAMAGKPTGANPSKSVTGCNCCCIQ